MYCSRIRKFMSSSIDINEENPLNLTTSWNSPLQWLSPQALLQEQQFLWSSSKATLFLWDYEVCTNVSVEHFEHKRGIASHSFIPVSQLQSSASSKPLIICTSAFQWSCGTIASKGSVWRLRCRSLWGRRVEATLWDNWISWWQMSSMH